MRLACYPRSRGSSGGLRRSSNGISGRAGDRRSTEFEHNFVGELSSLPAACSFVESHQGNSSLSDRTRRGGVRYEEEGADIRLAIGDMRIDWVLARPILNAVGMNVICR